MTGLACGGAYCDNMQLECTPLATGRLLDVPQYQSREFSEEQPAQYFNHGFAFWMWARGSNSDRLTVFSALIDPES